VSLEGCSRALETAAYVGIDAICKDSLASMAAPTSATSASVRQTTDDLQALT